MSKNKPETCKTTSMTTPTLNIDNKKLVNLPNNLNGNPTTTSYIISEHLKRKHSNVTRLIQKRINDFAEFGQVRFEIEPAMRSNQKVKAYILNEDQSMLLFTFMSNSKPVIQFKKQLIKRFREIYNELHKIKIERILGVNQRLSITNAIKEYIPESKHKRFMYSNFTNLIYKISLEKPVKQIRKERLVPDKANLRDYLNKNELERVGKIETIISSLIELGKTYNEIKSILL